MNEHGRIQTGPQMHLPPTLHHTTDHKSRMQIRNMHKTQAIYYITVCILCTVIT